jgi:hypothetical protein
MQRFLTQVGLLLPALALALMTARTDAQDLPKDKGTGAEKPAAKADPAVIAKLIEQLASTDSETREKASEQLAALDEVPDALRKAANSPDAEVARRARMAIAAVTARLDEKAFQAMLRDLHKVELDRLVRGIVAGEKVAGEKQWDVLQAIARAVTQQATKLSGRQFGVTDFDVRTMRRLLLKAEAKNPVAVAEALILSDGPTPYITAVSSSVVIVDGDFTGATSLNNSLLIVRGNVGRVTSVTGSIIIATGNFEGATRFDNSFLQVNNDRIRFTGSRDSVLIRTMVKTTGPTTSRVLDADKGPLELLRFSPRKADHELVWGKEFDSLAVAITPTDRKDQFLIRWKNVGKDVMQLPLARLNGDRVAKNGELLSRLILKGPDGKLVPAREFPAAPAGAALLLRRAVILGPGKTHEEVVDLWTYVDRPAAQGRYQLSVELDIPAGFKGLDWEVRSWSGKVQSNVLDITLGK